MTIEKGHVACLIDLEDSKQMMVDLTLLSISWPFIFQEEYAADGNYWELIDKNNLFGIHRRIYILDKKGLVALIYSDRGVAISDPSQAILFTTKAIELDPKLAAPHGVRALSYATMGKSTEALADLTKAIELNPKSAGAYAIRGLLYHNLHRYTESREDYSKAIELNPIYVKAYYGRGIANANLDNIEEAKKDL
jgi:tetratricopeptide (TPR) repeat protein